MSYLIIGLVRHVKEHNMFASLKRTVRILQTMVVKC